MSFVIYRKSVLTFDLEESLDQWFSMEIQLAFRWSCLLLCRRVGISSPQQDCPTHPIIRTESFRFKHSLLTAPAPPIWMMTQRTNLANRSVFFDHTQVLKNVWAWIPLDQDQQTFFFLVNKDRNCMASAWNIYYLAFYRKSLLTSALHSPQ